MPGMNDLWQRLEAWAKKSGRTLRLRPGATEKAIAAAEKKMKLTFPADFRASLLLHDGQQRKPGDDDPETSTLFEWMPGSGALASLSAIVAQWKDERENDEEEDDEPEIEGGVYNVMSHPRRIPIAGSAWWDGDNTSRSPPGAEGQERPAHHLHLRVRCRLARHELPRRARELRAGTRLRRLGLRREEGLRAPQEREGRRLPS